MRLYHVTIGKRTDRLYAPERILVAFDGRRRTVDMVLSAKKAGRAVILDCGAFSALTQGKVIDLDEYVATCFAVRHAVDFYAALDVIGDPDASFANWAAMRAAGLHDAVPTLHAWSSLTKLDRILEAKPEYIGVGGLVGRALPERIEWLDQIWSHLAKMAPGIKVHGWGQTDPPMMLRYPWTSVDSSYYIRQRRFGSRWELPDGRIVSRHSRGVLQAREAVVDLDHVAELATEKWGPR